MRVAASGVMKFEISCCVAGERKRHFRRMEGPAMALAIEPLEERESIEERVAQSLRTLIVTGQLPEGTQLVQRDLAARLGVSQTPVRASLGRLEREGFIAVGATGRSFVSRLTREDFEEIYAARRGLEALAARVGTEAMTEGDVAEMEAWLIRLLELAEKEEIDEYLRARWEFHATCYRAAKRPRLLSEVERLFWRSERYNRLVLASKQRFSRSVSNYHKLYEACRAHDPDGAERAIDAQMRWAVESVGSSLPSEADEA
jgi:DNA-binding GntR family transcriptional regulator